MDIEYKDFFDGNKTKTETMYFNISAFELAELAVEFNGPSGFADYMRKAFETEENYKEGFAALKMLFVQSYGRREKRVDSEGVERVRFIKKPEWVAELLPSPEFEAVFLKLSSDAKFATAFWTGLVSEEMLARATAITEADGAPTPEPGKKKFRDMTLQEQVAAMREKAAARGVTLDD